MVKNIQRVYSVEIQAMKERKEKIVMLTAYDALFAGLEDEAGIDVILVGDSAGMVVAGHNTTLPVTMEQMLYHTSCVTRVVKRAMVVSDMPFMSFQLSPEQALANAGRFLKEAGAQGVKVEGGEEIADTVDKMVNSGIPVIGHIGLTPQSIYRFGGYTLQGRDPESAAKLKLDARSLEEAGACMIVLEKVVGELAKNITRSLRIPTIGIGSGVHCDGQVLVVYDMLGLYRHFRPKFVRRYLELAEEAGKAFVQYRDDIKNGQFPGPEESY